MTAPVPVRAAAATLAAAAAFVTLFVAAARLGGGSQSSVLAAVLALSLARRPLPAKPSALAAYLLAIPLLALAAAAVGALLLRLPWLGAIAFVAGMVVSVWLRDFGDRARTAGGLLALPLVGMLIVPVLPGTVRGAPLVELALVALAGVAALGYVAATRVVAAAFGVALTAPEAPRSASDTRPKKPGRLSAPVRMAAQMGVALGAAFVVGFLVFPGHWSWCVLTAFIVCSGALGRGDAAYKGALRLAGAAGGTLFAVFVPTAALHGPKLAVLVFFVLFIGLALREATYAYWAACMTLVLALLAGSDARPALALLGLRLEAILAGALCAVAATWFVLPIRTEDVLRRRLADALVALDELVSHAHRDPAEHERALAAFERRIEELERVAPPLRFHRYVSLALRRSEPLEHPASWVDLAHDSGHGVASFATSERRAREPDRGSIRRAIGVSRRALANHGKPDAPAGAPSVGAALLGLCRTVDSEMEALFDDDERAREVGRDARGRRGRVAAKGRATVIDEQ